LQFCGETGDLASNEILEKRYHRRFVQGKGKMTPAEKANLVGKVLQVSSRGTLYACRLVYGWYDSAWAVSADGKQFDVSWEEVSMAIKNNQCLVYRTI
jgi:hypothetical protein